MNKRCRGWACLPLLCAAWLSAWDAPRAAAHPAYLTDAQATIEPDGHFRLVMQFDTLAFALNDTSARIGTEPMEALLAGPRDELEARLLEARGRFVRAFAVRTDRGPAPVREVEFPRADAVLAWRDKMQPALPVILPVRLTGELPPGTKSVAFRFPAVLDQVILIVERPGLEPSVEPVEAGTVSSPLPVQVAPAAAQAAANPHPRTEPAGPGGWAAVGRYVELGFHHILPGGRDRLLFVLGLFLLSARLRPLLVQITAFTVAQSITLGLSLYGVIRLPPAVVEPLIALSIVIVAVENLRPSRLEAGRPLIVFFFGLMYGLDFAAALTGLSLPRHDFFPALVGFNAGVGSGQLAVVALALATVGLLRHWPRYRQAVVCPCATAIAAVALYWTVQRVCSAIPS